MVENEKKIFILTGEPSGDYYGAELTKTLFELNPELIVEGAGGVQMKDAGAKIICETSHLGVIGILNAVLKIIPILSALNFIIKHLEKNPPDVLITVDFGAFNMYVLRKLQRKIPTLYYIPPGCWARNRKAGELPFLVSAIATPFSWSADNLKSAGAEIDIEWVGHPLLDSMKPEISKEEIKQKLGLKKDEEVLAIIPGSRSQELKYMLPMFLRAVEIMEKKPKLIISLAKNIDKKQILSMIPRNLEVIHYADGLDKNYLQAATAAFVTSGTATLEMALLNIPMVVSYRGSNVAGLQYQFWKNKKGFEWISLPNIILQRGIIPEYVQYNANSEALYAEMMNLLTNDGKRQEQLLAFKELHSCLGSPGSILRAAKMALKLLK